MKSKILILILSISSFFIFVSAGSLYAKSVTYSQSLDFYAPTQSFWGPGGSSADFHLEGDTGGDIGFYSDARASTGTVTSDFNGALSVRYDDLPSPGTTNLNIGFNGDSDGGFFNTFLGASLKLGYHVYIDLPEPADDINASGDLFNADYAFNIDKYYTPVMDTKFSGADDYVIFNVERVEIPGNAGSAGASALIKQTANFTADSIGGLLTYKHRDTGITKVTPFSIDSNGDISLPVSLDQQGYWDFYLTDIDLSSRFSTGFDFNANAYVDSVVDWSGEASIPIYKTPEFKLAFNQIDNLAAFSIYSAPEPVSSTLFILGGLAIFFRKRIMG